MSPKAQRIIQHLHNADVILDKDDRRVTIFFEDDCFTIQTDTPGENECDDFTKMVNIYHAELDKAMLSGNKIRFNSNDTLYFYSKFLVEPPSK